MQQQFDKSALVVAHPDDEILFFSSVIDQVDSVIICFMGNPRKPQRRDARLRVLADYPLETVSTLDVATSAAARFVDWERPVECETGLEIPDAAAREAYQDTHRQLVSLLRERLDGYRFVFTHNPWGEYGHADHVQVHRAVDSLATELGFRALFSNYVSPKSMKLALPYLCRTGYPLPVSAATNIDLAHRVRELYIREDCWTVPDDFIWPQLESFNSKTAAGDDAENSYLFALNFIPWRYRQPQQESLSQRVSRKLKRLRI